MTSLALDDASRVLAARTAAYDACVTRREHVGPTNYDFSFLSIDNALKTRRTYGFEKRVKSCSIIDGKNEQ